MKRLLLSLVSVLLLSSLVPMSRAEAFRIVEPELNSWSFTFVDGVLTSAEFTTQATGTITLDFGNAQTINVTAAQRTKLTRLLTDDNTARVANGQQAQTLEEWLRDKLVETVKRELDTADSHEQAEACQAFKNLTTNAQNQIKAALGDKSPCR